MENIFKSRIDSLKRLMRERCIDAYIVFSEDYHGSEYVNDHFKCREYLTGFNGSNGTLLVTEDEACMWTDGRYFLQAASQLKDTGVILMRDGMPEVPSLFEYLCENLSTGDTIGFDGRTVSAMYVDELKSKLEETDIEPSYATTDDLCASLWNDRPKIVPSKLWQLSEKYTGKSTKDKLSDIRKQMTEEGASSNVVTSLDDIAWIFNLRGDDVAYNPVFFSYLIITEKEAHLYLFDEALTGEVKAYLEETGTVVHEYGEFYEALADLRLTGDRVLTDKSQTSFAVCDILSRHACIIDKLNPSSLMKSQKNDVEAENIRLAHIKDGIALTKLLYRLKTDPDIEQKTELDICDMLLSLRKEQEGFIEESFAPIVATGANGAIIHYEPDESTNTRIQKNTFLLMDTGGQYLEGTTDVTRTIAIGEVSDEMKKLYTAVLKGNLRLANATVKSAGGTNIDILARTPLWELGYDYRHGTGHGVGYCLNVHEGPQSIRMKPPKGNADHEIKCGMLTSDEPGVYLDGEYGIRLESLMLTVPRQKTEYGEFLGFELVTMAPFDKSCILTEEMTAEDIDLLRAYYKKIREKLLPYLNEEEKQWLSEETKI